MLRIVFMQKKGIRVFGIAESFKKFNTKKSTLAGVVMRRESYN